MATNFEFYSDKIIESLKAKGGCVGAICSRIVKGHKELDSNCEDETCEECLARIFEILKQEHIEQPKLTKRERAFCEVVQTGFVVRNHNNNLYWSSKKPRFSYGEWFADGGKISGLFFMEDGFTFIEDTDSKIWAVEDLLKLEVEE